MIKRMLSFVLALVFAVTPLLAASDTVGAMTVAEVDIESRVRKQFLDYVAAFDAGEAVDGARQLLNHAVNGNGKQLNMDESDAFTITMLNSGLFQEGVIHATTAALENLLQTYDSQFFMRGYYYWYDHKIRYGQAAYHDNENGNDEDDKRVSPSITASVEEYTGEINQYDDALILVAGSVDSRIKVQRVGATADTLTFKVTVKMFDDFNFNGSYSGKDAALAKLLTAFGKVFSLGMWKTYSWTTVLDFEVTVPNLCTHQTGNYRWEFNGTDLYSVTSGGNTENRLTRIQTEKTDGTLSDPYYKTDAECHLLHYLPWVVEFRMKGTNGFILAPAKTYAAEGQPYLLKTHDYVHGGEYFKYQTTDSETGEEVTKGGRKQYGVKFTDYGYKRGDIHTYRLENRIAEDGSNMVYLLVDGVDLGPMDQFCLNLSYINEEQGVRVDWFNGQDIDINYVFNASFPFVSTITMEYIQIWENGEDADPYDYRSMTTVTPSHTQTGKTTYTCALCHSTYTEYIPETHDEQTVPGYAATCTKDGRTDGSVCTTCGKSLAAQEVIPALGHREQIIPGTVTCTQAGLTDGKVCSVCDKILVQQTESEALGHEWDEGMVTTGMTCTTPGVITYTCGNDASHTYTEEIPAAHTPVTISGSKATCTNSGLTDASKCNTCGEILIRHTIIAPLGHSYEAVVTEPGCTTGGYTTYDCVNCGDHYVDHAVDAAGHQKVVDEAVAATCTEAGLTEGSHCAVCNTIFAEQTATEALGHTWDDGEQTRAPTEDTAGVMTYTCTRCKETKEEVLPELEHVHSYEENVTDPTCTEKGYTTRICNACADSYVDSYTDAVGHSFRDGSCAVCGAEDPALLPGDANNDGKVDNIDAMLILQYAVGLSDGKDMLLKACDVDNNGNINNIDAMLILQYAVGLIEGFSISE